MKELNTLDCQVSAGNVKGGTTLYLAQPSRARSRLHNWNSHNDNFFCGNLSGIPSFCEDRTNTVTTMEVTMTEVLVEAVVAA